MVVNVKDLGLVDAEIVYDNRRKYYIFYLREGIAMFTAAEFQYAVKRCNRWHKRMK